MNLNRRLRFSFLMSIVLVGASACNDPKQINTANLDKGVLPLQPYSETATFPAGQTVFVPVYSTVLIANKPLYLNLAVVMTIRNTDTSNTIIIRSVEYHGQSGQLIRQYLKEPIRLAPRAAKEFFVKEDDTDGGIASSFYVDWVAESAVSLPVIDAVMAGTSGAQGISFSFAGQAIKSITP